MTTSNSQAFYDNPAVWDASKWQDREGDSERAGLASQWLSGEVHTIIDVGCGNGVFTNLPEPNRKKVGLDMSRIALEHISAPRLQGDASLLPFADHSFDASLSMEMLEHLPQVTYQRGLDELARVARRYILITVPYNEELKNNFVTCPQCKHNFHPYNHVREYHREDFTTLFGVKIHLVRLEGVVQTKRQALSGLWNMYRAYRHRQGRNFPPMAVCPQCGYTSDKNPADKQNPIQGLRSKPSLGQLWPKHTTYTWWMALFRREV